VFCGGLGGAVRTFWTGNFFLSIPKNAFLPPHLEEKNSPSEDAGRLGLPVLALVGSPKWHFIRMANIGPYTLILQSAHNFSHPTDKSMIYQRPKMKVRGPIAIRGRFLKGSAVED
jgi:hypothetical protein